MSHFGDPHTSENGRIFMSALYAFPLKKNNKKKLRTEDQCLLHPTSQFSQGVEKPSTLVESLGLGEEKRLSFLLNVSVLNVALRFSTVVRFYLALQHLKSRILISDV